jgi:phenylacetate-CoA ligase
MSAAGAGSRYFDPAIETMPRDSLARLQEDRLLDTVRYAYARSGLVREVWGEAGVTPDDVRSIDDFRERAPFIDKNRIRAYRDRHGDPYGGVLCVPESELRGIYSTSGTTGDPTLVPSGAPPEPDGGGRGLLVRSLWEIGVRPGDHIMVLLFTFRGNVWPQRAQALGATPVYLDHSPAAIPRFIELSQQLHPSCVYHLSPPLLAAVEECSRRLDVDPRDLFAGYKGVMSGGEAVGGRMRALLDSWGVDLFTFTAVGDVSSGVDCREHQGVHVWEDALLLENLDPAGAEEVDDGGIGELTATSLENRVAPLIRYRCDDLARVARATCGCGRTHSRISPIGRKGDEVIVEGRTILPRDLGPAVESVPETEAGFFQVIRPSREMSVLRVRVGQRASTRTAQRVRDDVADRVATLLGVPTEVEIVDVEELLKLGPPHKIPRVTQR